MSKYTTHAGWRIVLKQLGIEPSHVLRRAHLPDDLFLREGLRLPAADYFALWSAVRDESGDPNLPVQLVSALSAEAFDPPIFAALCSPNLNTAARRISEYKPLVCPMTLTVHVGDEATSLTCTWPSSPTPPTFVTATELLFWVGLARLGTRERIVPLSIQAPALHDGLDAAAYAGVPITLGPQHAITFSAEDAARPFLTANASMWSFFEPELARRLSELDLGASTRERARAAILELLPAGGATMAEVGRKLGVSGRTLQRRLREEGTTLSVLVADTRESLARYYLANSSMPAAEISFLLGYSDPNSFYRAFHAWTGLTPETARNAAHH